MKKRMIVILLALALLVSAFPAAASATAKEPLTEALRSIDRSRAAELTVLENDRSFHRAAAPETKENYTPIRPCASMEGQHAMLGDLVVLEFKLQSSSDPDRKYFVYVFKGSEVTEENLVASTVGSFSASSSTYYLDLGWDTARYAAGAGEYLVACFTMLNGEASDAYAVTVTLTEEYIPLEYICLIDSESNTAVKEQQYEYNEYRQYTIGYYPSNASTPDRRHSQSIADKGHLQVSGRGGEITVKGIFCGKTSMSVSSAGKTAQLVIAVDHTSSEGYGVCSLCMQMMFHDVTPDAWYYRDVEYAVKNWLVNGIGNDLFAPDSPMTRAQLVTVLFRHALPSVWGENHFEDVGADLWYTRAVAWAAENGIVNGVGNGRFDPEGEVSREQLVTILYRYGLMCGKDVSQRADLSAFPDADEVSPWALDAMQWAVAEGLITGNAHSGNTWLEPQNSATRAQVAAILHRYIEN